MCYVERCCGSERLGEEGLPCRHEAKSRGVAFDDGAVLSDVHLPWVARRRQGERLTLKRNTTLFISTALLLLLYYYCNFYYA